MVTKLRQFQCNKAKKKLAEDVAGNKYKRQMKYGPAKSKRRVKSVASIWIFCQISKRPSTAHVPTFAQLQNGGCRLATDNCNKTALKSILSKVIDRHTGKTGTK